MTTAPFTAIIGMGNTGLACARYLQQQGQSFHFFDDRVAPPLLHECQTLFPSTPRHLGAFDSNLVCSAHQLIVSPGIDLAQPAIVQARAKGIPVLGDIELFARQAKAPIIAITGTNAKGTVTTLIGKMLQAAGHQVAVGGNIGTPALDLLSLPTPDFYVLEISSFQLETTYSLAPLAATILNISPDHLDRHGTLENYHKIKQRIYQHCQYAIVNADDHYSAPIYPVKKIISFSLNTPNANNFGIIENYLTFGTERLMPCHELRIQGKHNWANALAALALGKALNLSWEPMLTVLRNFAGLAHRCEWVANHRNIIWINDSKGTNIGATLAALNGIGATLTGKIILIAGGVGKNADFHLLQPAVTQFVRHLILMGQDAAQLHAALGQCVATQWVDTLSQAVHSAYHIAQPGDVVLLSPACASLDMFKDYADRGQQFKHLVKECIFHA